MTQTPHPRRRVFAAGRIAPKGTTAPVTHLSAHLGSAGLRITSLTIPEHAARGFIVELEAAAQRYEMERAVREAA